MFKFIKILFLGKKEKNLINLFKKHGNLFIYGTGANQESYFANGFQISNKDLNDSIKILINKKLIIKNQQDFSFMSFKLT